MELLVVANKPMAIGRTFVQHSQAMNGILIDSIISLIIAKESIMYHTGINSNYKGPTVIYFIGTTLMALVQHNGMGINGIPLDFMRNGRSIIHESTTGLQKKSEKNSKGMK